MMKKFSRILLVVTTAVTMFALGCAKYKHEFKIDGEYLVKVSSATEEHDTAGQLHDRNLIIGHFGKGIDTDAVLIAFKKNGLRPATKSEILALSAQHFELQRQFPRIKFGSVLPGLGIGRSVGCLSNRSFRYPSRFRWIIHGWHDGCRFAVVRK